MKNSKSIYYAKITNGGTSTRKRIEATSKKQAAKIMTSEYKIYKSLNGSVLTVLKHDEIKLSEHEALILSCFVHNKPVKIHPDFLTLVNECNMNIRSAHASPYGRILNTSDIFYISSMPSGSQCSLSIHIEGKGTLYVLCRSLDYLIVADY